MPESVDVINTLYENLFSVRFLHPGFGTPASNSLSQSIRVFPDQSTKRLFRDYGISYKIFNDLLVCYIRSRLFAPPATDLKVPFISFQGEIRIRLLLYSTRDFMDRTAVVATGKNQVYHFSNRINNVIGPDPFVSRPIDVYVAASDYSTGTIVQEGAQLFQALQHVFDSDNIAISDPAYWQEVLPVEQLVNNADLQETDSLELDDTCFAVIDIFNSGTTNNAYNLFVTGPDNQLRSPVYNLRFKSKI
ncbi:MAG: hypothetical protein WD398_07285 [Cyclobacteriaceae bacterium]